MLKWPNDIFSAWLSNHRHALAAKQRAGIQAGIAKAKMDNDLKELLALREALIMADHKNRPFVKPW